MPDERAPGTEWRMLSRDGDRTVEHANEGTFDELVIDDWMHLEQLDPRTWWMRVGDARLQVTVGEHGALTLDVQRGFYGKVVGTTEILAVDDQRSEAK